MLFKLKLDVTASVLGYWSIIISRKDYIWKSGWLVHIVWNIYIPVTSASDIAAVLFVLYSSSVDNKFVLSGGTHGFCFVDKSCFSRMSSQQSCIDLTFCFESLLEIFLFLIFIPINCAVTHLKVFFQKPFLTENFTAMQLPSGSLKVLFENVDATTIIDFKVNFYHLV